MEYEHSYPVCWRCKSEVISAWCRLVYSHAGAEARLIAAAEKVKWEPASNGKRMQDWLNNMGDWNISRKRYYGMPLPFYPCEHCGHLTVVGSKEELKRLSTDRQKWTRCPRCTGHGLTRLKLNARNAAMRFPASVKSAMCGWTQVSFHFPRSAILTIKRRGAKITRPNGLRRCVSKCACVLFHALYECCFRGSRAV